MAVLHSVLYSVLYSVQCTGLAILVVQLKKLFFFSVNLANLYLFGWHETGTFLGYVVLFPWIFGESNK